MTPVERKVLEDKGYVEMRNFVYDVIEKRLDSPFNDGAQTPKSGHPVFIAQHATATCCRKCLHKWHQVPRHRVLNDEEKMFIAGLVLRWIRKDAALPMDKILEERRRRFRKQVTKNIKPFYAKRKFNPRRLSAHGASRQRLFSA